jgi:ATP-dependent helicase/nuclease subunit B
VTRFPAIAAIPDIASPKRHPRVYSIRAGAPFLETLADHLLDGSLVPASAGHGLAETTVYVPTRRAAGALAANLAERLSGAGFLPRILPLGGLDEAGLDGLLEAAGPVDRDRPDLPFAIGDIERRLILARLILHWSQSIRHALVSIDPAGLVRKDPSEPLVVAGNPVDAFRLSGDLAGMIDEMIIEGVAWDKVQTLCLPQFDDYWRITLDFLKIAIDAWPKLLGERGLVDRATRQMLSIDHEIERLEVRRLSGPVIAAGSTGTNRATARLLAAIAHSPQGAVVLPGLDLALDQRAWVMVGAASDATEASASHPQAALRRLLPILRTDRAAVVELGVVPVAVAPRIGYLNEALRPAAATGHWPHYVAMTGQPALTQGLADVALIEAADEREEALALAIALREALERPGETVALVTPDRSLAERVRAELQRWNVAVDDSGGLPLGRSQAGALARLTLAAAAAPAGKTGLSGLLAHSFVRLGFSALEQGPLREAFEIGLLRTTIPVDLASEPGALVAAAAQAARGRDAHPAQRRIRPAIWSRLPAYIASLQQALAPLAALTRGASLADWLFAHRQAVERLTQTETGDLALAGPGSSELFDLFAALTEASDPDLVVDGASYAALFDSAVSEILVHPPVPFRPRLAILGLLEARLLTFDQVLLGGLDETIWPPNVTSDAFLNRTMRAELGLSSPERRIGQTAHDFVALMGSRRAILSRALKRAGTPSVASRFLQRMAALAGETHWAAMRQRGEIYLAYARAIDRPQSLKRIGRPRPRPPLDLRPRALSVTRIETLRRDPYAIYAESILGVKPLEAIGAEPGAREIGILLHALVAGFARAHPSGPVPGDALDVLGSAAREVFAELLRRPAFRALRWPRIERALASFLAWERARRDRIEAIACEMRGTLPIALSNGASFLLTATADRLERRVDGSIAVVDFKSGTTPTQEQIAAGFATQVTLEAAMLQRGAFASFPAAVGTIEGAYVNLMKDAKERKIGSRTDPFTALAEAHFEGLVILLESFEDPDTAYVARPYPQFASQFQPYDHLARVKEWSLSGGVADSEA